MPSLLNTLQHMLLPFTLLLTPSFAQHCDAPSPAFLIPQLSHPQHASALTTTTTRISTALDALIANPLYNTTHFSLEVTSQTSTLLSLHHSARERSDLFHGGAKVTDNTTMYRIASMTKPFTVLALLQLEKAGKLALDESILAYLPDLNTMGMGKGRGGLPWKDITIRALASQIAGLPRDFAQGDLLGNEEMVARFGLPVFGKGDGELEGLPRCDQLLNYTRSCNETDLLEWVDGLMPLYAPNQKSSYSNIGFDLLGLVIANISGIGYEEYIETKILREIGLEKSGFSTPPDEVAAIVKGEEYYWPFAEGVQNPTGGMYSSAAEMSTWLRYILSTYNAQTHALSWFNPTSWSGSLNTFYGLPWEIFRTKTNEVIPDKSTSTRPLTFVTKGGGLPAYRSAVIMVPEYGLGITILVAGHGLAFNEMLTVVAQEVVSFAEGAALKELNERYVGTYDDKKTNSTLRLDVSERDGLFVDAWKSRGVDVKQVLNDLMTKDGSELIFHLVPTLLYVDEKNQDGERWRVDWHKRRTEKEGNATFWDNYCVSDIETLGQYAGKPVNELVFWGGDQGEKAAKVELTGYRSTLKRSMREEHKGQTSSQAVLVEQQGV